MHIVDENCIVSHAIAKYLFAITNDAKQCTI